MTGDTDYETTGAGYETRRRPDPRIAALVHEHLGAARTVLNVGAGAGSYEPDDRYVLAIEPSAAMRARRAAAGLAPAVDAFAEAIPLDDAAVDAAMAILTVHQWADPARGLAELRRVTRGSVVVLTLDLAAMGRFWLEDYLPERRVAEQRRFPAPAELGAGLGGHVEVTAVPIPLDCTDGFVEAFYGRPEALLDPAVRAAQSAWQFVPDTVAAAGWERLADDLATGRWDARYGALRTQPTLTGPLVLVTSRP